VEDVLRDLIVPDIDKLVTADERELPLDRVHVMIAENSLYRAKLVSGDGNIHAGKYPPF
jgi:hypothetical protein